MKSDWKHWHYWIYSRTALYRFNISKPILLISCWNVGIVVYHFGKLKAYSGPGMSDRSVLYERAIVLYYMSDRSVPCTNHVISSGFRFFIILMIWFLEGTWYIRLLWLDCFCFTIGTFVWMAPLILILPTLCSDLILKHVWVCHWGLAYEDGLLWF